jgi:uncharacterized protein with von Willebrand factor type A (vWA) domain
LTVRELEASARLGAKTTFFRLGDSDGLARFVEHLARRVDGRVVAPELDELGVEVVESYLGSRRARHTPRQTYSDWFGGRGFWVGG